MKISTDIETNKKKPVLSGLNNLGSMQPHSAADTNKSSPEILRLKKIKGQVAGLEKMYQDHRYCIDIIQQIRACSSALKALERETLRKHLQKCVKEAVRNQDSQQVDTKFAEIFNLLK